MTTVRLSYTSRELQYDKQEQIILFQEKIFIKAIKTDNQARDNFDFPDRAKQEILFHFIT